jgi:transcriptional regulator with XRE-family HTH domain
MDDMSVRQSPADVGADRARRIIHELGRNIRETRLSLGLSQSDVAEAIGLSRSCVSRIEVGVVRSVSVWHLARIFSVLGQDFVARSYPSGEPIRDAGHVRVLERLRAHVHPSFAWRYEVPVRAGSDLRAWDAMLVRSSLRVAVEAETRPRDIQALERRLELKKRDGGVERVVLLLPDTRHNRELLRRYGPALQANFPVPGRVALAALVRGEDPGGSSVVIQ